MNRQEALEKLELDEDASHATIESTYQELYNEFQMRITNAPTEHQRKLYQKKLKELEDAHVTLQGTLADDSELPQTGPSISQDTQQPAQQIEAMPPSEKPEPEPNNLASSLEVLGLADMPESEEALKSAYEENSEALSASLNSARATIRQVAEQELKEVTRAYDFLQAALKVKLPDSDQPATEKVQAVAKPPVAPKPSPAKAPKKKEQPINTAPTPTQKSKSTFFLPFIEAAKTKLKATIAITLLIPVFLIWVFNFPDTGGDPVFPDYDQMEKHWLFYNIFMTAWLSYVAYFIWHIVKQSVVRYLFSIPMFLSVLLCWASTKDYTEEFDFAAILSLPFMLFGSLISLVIMVYAVVFWIRYALNQNKL